MEYTKEEFNKVTIQTLKSRGDHISLNAVKMIEEMQEQAINYTHCCTELKALKDGKNGEGMDLVRDFNKAFRNL